MEKMIDRFDGNIIDRDNARAHTLSFEDYLYQTDISPEDGDLEHVVRLFKQSLKGSARLWVENRDFDSYASLKEQFINKFSTTKTTLGLFSQYSSLQYDCSLSPLDNLERITKLASQLDYNASQIRDKFISVLPNNCKQSVIMVSSDDTPVEILAAKAQRYFDVSSSVPSSTAKEVSFSMSELQDEVSNLTLDLSTPSPYTDSSVRKVQSDRRLHRSPSTDRNVSQSRFHRSQSPHNSRSFYRTQSPLRDHSTFRNRSPCPQSPHNSRSFYRTQSPRRDHSTFRNRSQYPYNSRSSYRTQFPSKHRSENRSPHPSRPRVIFCDYCLYPGHTWQFCYVRQEHLSHRQLSQNEPTHPNGPTISRQDF
ncbi:hypothetical protein SNE40_011193 [Patella caerulea]|uniref:Uncharacterized protein n=1 Tax=Patella caerulea TaxID=87958 RepID=A0AAN8JI97_PATCE